MNILEIATFLRGGAGNFITNLCIELKKMGHCVDIISTGSYGEFTDWQEYNEAIKRNNISHFKQNFFKRDNDIFWYEVDKLSSLIAGNYYDIIHVHAGVPALAANIAKEIANKQIPVIATYYSWSLDRPEWMNIADVYSFNLCNKVFCISEEYLKFAKAKGIKSSDIIYPGLLIDHKQYRNKRKFLRKKIIEDFNLPESAYIITNLGEITERKGQLDLIKAFDIISNKIESPFLFLIGESREKKYFEKVREIIYKYKLGERIIITGWLDDPYNIITASDLFVFPTYSEGLGMAIIEAIALGIPTIFSSIEGTKDIEAMLGENCLGTFIPGNYEVIADMILKLSKSNKVTQSNILSNSVQIIENTFSFGHIVSKYEKEMKNLVKQKY